MGFGIILLVSFMTACSGPSFFSQKMVNSDFFKNEVEILDDGAVKSQVYAGLSSPQKIELDSGDEALGGASVIINPGALSISSGLFVEQGEDLLSGSFTSGLGLADEVGIEGASEALLVEPEENINPVGSLLISIPLSSSSLRLNDVIYSVVYEVFDYANKRYLKGIIPTSKITIKDGYAEFETDFFGNFQVITSRKKISQAIVVESTNRPSSQRVRNKNPLIKLYKPVLKFTPAGRSLSAKLSVEDKNALKECRVFFDIDKKLPYRLSSLWNLASEGAATVVPNIIRRMSARLECIDKQDRRLTSDWSDEIATPYSSLSVGNEYTQFTLSTRANGTDKVVELFSLCGSYHRLGRWYCREGKVRYKNKA